MEAKMSLDDWLIDGWLKSHQARPAEIADLLALADLKDCRASA